MRLDTPVVTPPVLTAEAAKILNVTPASVRAMDRRGELIAVRTLSGVRLFDRDQVERLARERSARRLGHGSPESPRDAE